MHMFQGDSMNIAALPKVELHCHLDGILSPAMVRKIQRSHPAFPIHADVLERAYQITGLESFFNWWQYITPLDARLDYYALVIQNYIEQLKAQNVRYFEVMIASGEIAPDPVEAVEKMQAFRESVNQCEAGQIQVEFLVVLNRQHPPEKFEERAARVRALHEAGLISGVVLAGPEIGNPVKPFERTFARFHEAGLNIEIHAGEWSGAESVWDALQHGYPNRIGHGVTLFDDPHLVEIFQERQIHLEVCPTSNLQTGSIARIEDHPIRKALEAGLNVGINTDDPGTFGCSMNSEYALITETFGFTEAEWMTLYRNALNARFQPNLKYGI
jgi:aminodeoxyfutalosine deaminase